LRIALGCDHGGFLLKPAVLEALADAGCDVIDCGAYSTDSVDYPDYAKLVAEKVVSKEAELGIVICGTGIGISIAANKVKGIRAALCSDTFSARMSREHNNANILALGARVIGPSLAQDIVKAFLSGSFAGGRHAIRVDKITALEEE
jgi:ribose 5-phosphate isomerase B